MYYVYMNNEEEVMNLRGSGRDIKGVGEWRVRVQII